MSTWSINLLGTPPALPESGAAAFAEVAGGDARFVLSLAADAATSAFGACSVVGAGAAPWYGLTLARETPMQASSSRRNSLMMAQRGHGLHSPANQDRSHGSVLGHALA